MPPDPRSRAAHGSKPNADLLHRALPVRQRRELLTVLAGACCENVAAPWSAAAFVLPSEGEVAVQFVPAAGELEYRELTLPPGKPFADELAIACEDAFADIGNGAPPAVTLLKTAHGTAGALLTPSGLIPDSGLAADASLLLSQLAVVEAAQPNGKGVDWLNRAKLEALIQFAAGAGHEINNPVAAISGRVQLLLKDEQDPVRREALATIGAQALRISHMIGDTMQFAEPPPLRLETCDVEAVVRRILNKLKPRIAAQGTEVKLRFAPGLKFTADQTQLETLVAELLSNSLNALGQGGVIHVRTRPPEPGRNGFGLLEVSDNGPGLTEMDRRHLFDPFYSGRQAGRGLGFGLCKCSRIALRHGGAIHVSSVPWVETVFSVQWPVAAT